MKKVFSVEKFKECCKRLGRLKSQIKKSCEIWANECEGLTKDEMKELGYLCSDDWTIEVEERKNEPSKLEIELISILAIGFVYETVNELMKMLGLDDDEKEEKNKKEKEVKE